MLTCVFNIGFITLDGVDTAGYSGDVWDEQPPSKDHPWKKMPKQAMTPHTSGTTLDAQVLLLFCVSASRGLVQAIHDCLCTVLQLCVSAAVMCDCCLAWFVKGFQRFFLLMCTNAQQQLSVCV